MVRTRFSIATLSVAALLSATGCFKSYVVVSFRAPQDAGTEATASGTPVLDAARATLRTVAIRAPSACTPDASLSATGGGVALRSRTVLESRCDTWVGELERALALQYKVVGWRELARREREGGAAAAREAGADLVLVVKELVAEPLLVSAADSSAVVLTRATPRGEPTPGSKVVPPKADRTIRTIVASHYPDGMLVGVRATIEIAAVPASGGDPLWTYRGRISDSLTGALESRMLLRGRRGTWRPVAPRGWRANDAAAARASPADPVQARLRELAATIAADVVARFTTAG